MADKLQRIVDKTIDGGFKKGKNFINLKMGEKYVKKRF